MAKFHFLISTVIFFLAALHMSIPGQAQRYSDVSKESIQKLYRMINDYYGPNQELINGYVYHPADSRRKGTPFLEGAQWSSVVLYIKGNTYRRESIKYHLAADEIVLKASMQGKRTKLVEMNKYQLDSFNMKGRMFVNSRHYGLKEDDPTYYHVIYDRGGLTFVRHYSKRFVDKYDLNTPYGKYTDVISSDYLIGNHKLHPVDSRYSFLVYFNPSQRKKIKRFILKHRIKYRKAEIKELISLLEFCHDLLQQP